MNLRALSLLAILTLAFALTPFRRARAFSWSNCDPPASSQLVSFAFSPAIAPFSEPISVVAELSLARDVTLQTDASVRVDHRIDGRRLPCADGLGGSWYAPLALHAPGHADGVRHAALRLLHVSVSSGVALDPRARSDDLAAAGGGVFRGA